jgi:hypothetical protein
VGGRKEPAAPLTSDALHPKDRNEVQDPRTRVAARPGGAKARDAHLRLRRAGKRQCRRERRPHARAAAPRLERISERSAPFRKKWPLKTAASSPAARS